MLCYLNPCYVEHEEEFEKLRHDLEERYEVHLKEGAPSISQ